MSIFGKLLKKKRKTLIITDDGSCFRGLIADDNGVITGHRFASGTELKKILTFGKEQNAGSVLYLQSADIRELDVKLGRDLSSDERKRAIEYAAASSEGDHSGNMRISYMDGMFHDFRSGILASYFDTGSVVDIARQTESMKMKFLGVTNFKQLLLAHHFSDQDHHNNGFLFFHDSSGIAAVPERSKLLIRNLPSGIPENTEDPEWQERIRRRLNNIFNRRQLCLYTPSADEDLCSVMQDISNAEGVEPVKWEDAVTGAALYFLQNGSRLIHPALPPPKAKDPKASGTYTGLFFLAATILTLGFLMVKNVVTKYIFERDIAAARETLDIVKREKDALADLDKKLLQEQEIFAVMKQQQRVAKNYLLVMNLLSRYPLRYSRITAITEKNNGIHLEGESVWQPDLSSFFTHFEGELSKYHLTLFSDGLSKEKDGRMIFRSHVAPAGRK